MQDEYRMSTPAAQEPDIVVEDESWKHGFTQVPNVILRNSEASFGAKVAYGILLSYAWQEGSCFPGQDRMAVDMGCTTRTVRKYLKELADAKIIRIERRGLGKSNRYHLPRLVGDPRR